MKSYHRRRWIRIEKAAVLLGRTASALAFDVRDVVVSADIASHDGLTIRARMERATMFDDNDMTTVYVVGELFYPDLIRWRDRKIMEDAERRLGRSR